MVKRKLSEIAREARLADSTTRRYIQSFPEYFEKTRGEGQRSLYGEEAVETLSEIARLYSRGLTTAGVREELREDYVATLDIAEQERSSPGLEPLASAMQRIADQREEIRELQARDRERELALEEVKERLARLEEAPAEPLLEEEHTPEDPLGESTDSKEALSWWNRFKASLGIEVRDRKEPEEDPPREDT